MHARSRCATSLEFKAFDIVLCEHHFGKDSATGQDLLDDLRRNQLLPFSTVFIMVTGEASYAKVAEAAESALDGYLLKPHTASNLGDRLFQARQRKISLHDIFAAIEADEFERAATLCMAALREPRSVLALCRTHRRRAADARRQIRQCPDHVRSRDCRQDQCPGPSWAWRAPCSTTASRRAPSARWRT